MVPPSDDLCPMRPAARNLPIILLVVAMLLLDAVAYVSIVNEEPRHVSSMSGAPIYALALSQACLLGMWAGFGRTRTAIRLPVVVALLAVLIRLICYLAPQYPIPWYFQTSVLLNLGLTAGVVAVAAGLARLLEVARLVRLGETVGGMNAATTWRQFQFSLSQMLQMVASFGLRWRSPSLPSRHSIDYRRSRWESTSPASRCSWFPR